MDRYMMKMVSWHNSIGNLLESIIMRSPRIHTTPLHQPLTKPPKLPNLQPLLKPLPKPLNPKPLKTLQITLTHHNLQHQTQLPTSLPDRIHAITEQIYELLVIWGIFAAHQQDVFFG